jgi:hypothetical protein
LKHLDPQDGAHCSLPQFLSPLTALAATPPREAGYREAISCFGTKLRITTSRQFGRNWSEADIGRVEIKVG